MSRRRIIIIVFLGAAAVITAVSALVRRERVVTPAVAESAARSAAPAHAAALPAPRPSKPRVERLYVEEGVVVITTAARASAKDLGVPAFSGAREARSSVWHMKPPRGKEWVLAVGEFTTAASLQRVEEFYRKALGRPEVRRAREDGQSLVTLSRVRGSEYMVIRISGAAGKPASILIRRAIQGSPVKLEPTGPPGLRVPEEIMPEREDAPRGYSVSAR